MWDNKNKFVSKVIQTSRVKNPIGQAGLATFYTGLYYFKVFTVDAVVGIEKGFASSAKAIANAQTTEEALLGVGRFCGSAGAAAGMVAGGMGMGQVASKIGSSTFTIPILNGSEVALATAAIPTGALVAGAMPGGIAIVLMSAVDEDGQSFMQVQGKRGPPKGYGQKVTDEELSTALRKHGGNQTKAAEEVKLASQVIGRRIKNAKPGSPLVEFKDVKVKGGPAPRVSDGALAVALRKHGGNETKAAEEVKLARQVIGRRIKNAKPGSPLVEFKDVKVKGGPAPRVSDGALAVALRKHGGNQTRAAREVELSVTEVRRRFTCAKPNSLLSNAGRK